MDDEMPRLRFRNHKVVKAPKQSKKPKRVVTAIDLTRSPPKPVRTNRAAELPQNHATAINTLAQTNSCLTQQLFEKTELLLQTEEKYIAHLGNCYKLKMENERLRKENAELKARLEPIIQLDEDALPHPENILNDQPDLMEFEENEAAHEMSDFLK